MVCNRRERRAATVDCYGRVVYSTDDYTGHLGIVEHKFGVRVDIAVLINGYNFALRSASITVTVVSDVVLMIAVVYGEKGRVAKSKIKLGAGLGVYAAARIYRGYDLPGCRSVTRLVLDCGGAGFYSKDLSGSVGIIL